MTAPYNCPDWCAVTPAQHAARVASTGAYAHEADVTIWGVDGHLPVGRVTRLDGTDDPRGSVVLLSSLAADELTPAQARSLAASLLIAADMASDPERPHPAAVNWAYRPCDHPYMRDDA